MEVIQRRSNLSDHVTEELGRAIVRGDFGPEDGFPTEADLCLEFGVSRTAVREAVKMLSAKGLIASKPRQGIRVMPRESWNILDADLLAWSLHGEMTPGVLRQFFQLRAALEPEAAALAAQYASPEHVQTIEDALGRMRAEDPHSEAGIDADLDFHTALLYATENPFYIRLRDFLRTALTASIDFTTPATEHSEEILDAHAKVFRAIKSGNVVRARNSMRSLIDRALVKIE